MTKETNPEAKTTKNNVVFLENTKERQTVIEVLEEALGRAKAGELTGVVLLGYCDEDQSQQGFWFYDRDKEMTNAEAFYLLHMAAHHTMIENDY